VKKMQREAESHADEDKRQRELIEKRNRADSLAYNVERTLKEHGSKLAAGDRTKIEDAMKEVREAIKGDDAARIERATETLNQASYAIAQMLYQQTGPTGGPGASGPDGQAGPGAPGAGGQARGRPKTEKGQGGDDVIDAEYEVKE